MFLRPNNRTKDGKPHTYWSLVETVRTPDGPRQRTLCYLGELNGSAQARWLKTIEVFNEQGESRQLKLFPAEVEPPEDDPNVARVLLNKVRLERSRQFGNCFVGLELWKRLELDRFYEELIDEDEADVAGLGLRRCWRSTGCVNPAANWQWKSAGIRQRRWTTCWESRKERSMTRGSIVAWTISFRTRLNWNVISGSVMESCSPPPSTCCSTI